MAKGALGVLGQVVRLGASRLGLKFVTVGIVGLAVAEGVLYFLADVLRLDKLVAGASSLEVSVIANFMLNDVWTFRERRFGDGFLARMLKFHVSRAASVALNFAVYSLLIVVVGLNHLVSYLIGVVAAFSLNFLTSVVWIWRGVSDSREASGESRLLDKP